jgi:hypothetical protein
MVELTEAVVLANNLHEGLLQRLHAKMINY